MGNWKRIHMGLSVRGAILNLASSDSVMAPGFSHDNGKPMRRLEAIDGLLDHLVEGTAMLCIAEEPCPGWDPKTGCPGHPYTTEED